MLTPHPHPLLLLYSSREKPGATRPHFLGPAGGKLASRAGGLRPQWVAFGHLGSPFHMSSPPRMLPVTTPLVPSLTYDNPPWSPHPPLTTPHGPLTRLGQPPLVPSLILNQLIKNDLDLFLLDRAAVAAGVALIYIRICQNVSHFINIL